jgi:hypothetical protein
MQTPIKINGSRTDQSGSHSHKAHRKLKLPPESASRLAEKLDSLPVISAHQTSRNIQEAFQYQTEGENGHESVMSTIKQKNNTKHDISKEIYHSHVFS